MPRNRQKRTEKRKAQRKAQSWKDSGRCPLCDAKVNRVGYCEKCDKNFPHLDTLRKGMP